MGLIPRDEVWGPKPKSERPNGGEKQEPREPTFAEELGTYFRQALLFLGCN